MVAAVALVGCSKKTAPQTTAPAGFVAVRNASAGFAVAVPADWIQIPLPQDLDQFDKDSRALTANNNNLGPAIIQARQLLQYGGKLMAVSKDGASVVNLTVDKTKEKSLAEIASHTIPELEQNGATNVVQSTTTTGAGPSLKLTFKYPIQGQGDTTVMADEVQYLVLHNKRSFVLTVINGQPDLQDAVAASFRVR